jgi:hypothetical protein
MSQVAHVLDRYKTLATQLTGRRVREDGYFDDGVSYTGIIEEISAKGHPIVRWDSDGTAEPVPANYLIFLDNGEETDEQVRKRILGKFNTMDKLVRGVANKKLTGAIISGQGGVGKTHTVEAALCDILGKNEGTEDDPNGFRFHKVTGKTTPLALYETLYDNSGEDDITVFDDCDSVWQDSNCINLLKAALDTHPHRILFWKSKFLGMEAPPSFVFRGRILFLTNKLPSGEHFDALRSRTHNIDMQMTPRELMFRIEDIVCAPTYEYKDTTLAMRRECVGWMKDNVDRFASLNIRVALKLIDYYLMGEGWEEMADALLTDYA